MRVPNVAIVAIVGAVLFAASTLAAAADHPIGGVELGARRSKSGIERLVFSTKDDLPLPSPGSPDDPTSGSPGGITIELFSLGATQTVTFSAPRSASDPGWKRVKRGYQFKHAAAPDPVSAFASIRLHETGGIRFVGKRAGLALGGNEHRVGIRITMGGSRFCALFQPRSVRRDEPGAFLAKGASASELADCSDASLTPPLSGQCGDNVIDESEQCDGSALGLCGEIGGSCGTPGFSNQCSCCSANGEMVTLLGCCNPSSVAVSFGPAGGGMCAPLRCDAPYTCGSGAECLPSGDCCGRPENPCAFTLTGQTLQPCCAGSVCERPDASGFFLTCCIPTGGACGQDQECCSGSCSASGSCD